MIGGRRLLPGGLRFVSCLRSWAGLSTSRQGVAVDGLDPMIPTMFVREAVTQ